MTGRCSDTHRNCQQAVMNILGTELHATCVCKGTDFIHQHDCYTWQKLLWSNPCVSKCYVAACRCLPLNICASGFLFVYFFAMENVDYIIIPSYSKSVVNFFFLISSSVESHIKLHEEIAAGDTEELDKIFQRPPTVRTTIPPKSPFLPPTSEDDDRRLRPVDSNYGTVIYSPDEDMIAPPSQIYSLDIMEGSENGRNHYPTRPETKWGNTVRRPGLNINRNLGERIHGGGGRNGGTRFGSGRTGGGVLIGGSGRTGGGVLIGGSGRPDRIPMGSGHVTFGGTRDPSGGGMYPDQRVPPYGGVGIPHRGTPIPREDTKNLPPIVQPMPGRPGKYRPTYPGPEPEQITRQPYIPPERHGHQRPYDPIGPHIITPTPPTPPAPTSITSTTTLGTTTLPQRKRDAHMFQTGSAFSQFLLVFSQYLWSFLTRIPCLDHHPINLYK